ncbi:MAG TPA: MHYT domain-containing protein [Ramlibacter sp.]|nr:MHYT domain-containing protein [Ramlibacter sp.]
MTVNVGDILSPHYDIGTVTASYVVSVLGSYVALFHARYLLRRDGTLNWAMLIGGAVALGGVGIWTMHFIGMMGYGLPVRVVYEGTLTFLSLAAAVVIAGISLFVTGGRKKFSWPGWAFGSLLAGAGVCVMHYMGMYAMNLRASMTLDMAVVAISIAIAVTAAGAALWLAFHVVKNSHRILAALVMGVAVCAMHYTGMASAQFICTAQGPLPAWYVAGANLPMLVIVMAGAVLTLLCWNLFGVLADSNKVQRKTQKPRRTMQQPVAEAVAAARRAATAPRTGAGAGN